MYIIHSNIVLLYIICFLNLNYKYTFISINNHYFIYKLPLLLNYILSSNK